MSPKVKYSKHSGDSYKNRLTPRSKKDAVLHLFCKHMTNVRYTNTVSRGKFTVVRNVFVIVVNLDDYDDDAHRQTKRATYKEIHDWIKQNHGIHVSNHDISQAKMLCGLSKALHKGSQGAEEHDVPDLKPEKEAIIREAFKWFGII